MEFSNRGKILQFDPVRMSVRNPDCWEVTCVVPGCSNTTRSKYGLCSKCQKNKEKKECVREFKRRRHTKDWLGRIIPPNYERTQCLYDAPDHFTLTEVLLRWAGRDKERLQRLDKFIENVLDELVGRIPDATSLQEALESKLKLPDQYRGVRNPDDAVALAKRLVEGGFPKERFESVRLDEGNVFGKPWDNIPLRIAAALLVVGFLCEEANRGDAWYRKMHLKGSAAEPRQSGCLMSAGYYFYRRHTKATPAQIRMTLQIKRGL